MARNDPEFRLRLPAELKQKIAELAEKNGRSQNTEIVARLQESIRLEKAFGFADLGTGLPAGRGLTPDQIDEAIVVLEQAKELLIRHEDALIAASPPRRSERAAPLKEIILEGPKKKP